jgi:hypothetical protein
MPPAAPPHVQIPNVFVEDDDSVLFNRQHGCLFNQDGDNYLNRINQKTHRHPCHDAQKRHNSR